MPTQTKKESACGCITTSVTFLTRLSLLGYAALAALSLLEVRELLLEEAGGNQGTGSFYRIEGDTLYVSLAMCAPTGLAMFDPSINATATDGASSNSALQQKNENVDTCRSVDYLINACAAALVFSAFAALLYLIIDCTARCKFGPNNTSAAGGMGLFLVFILLQSAISTVALQEQSQYWLDYFQDLVDDANDAGDGNIRDVKSPANTWYWLITAIAACGTSALILLDWSLQKCCTRKVVVIDEAEEIVKAQQAMDQQQKAVEDAAQTSPKSSAGTANSTPRAGDFSHSTSNSSIGEIDYDEPSIVLGESKDSPKWASNV